VDPDHSRVGFSVRHLGIATVRGQFTRFEGQIETDDDLSAARITATVDAASVFTNQPKRDEHLKSADFFDTDQYPQLTFESTNIETVDAELLRITGNLTLHGITREIVLDAVVQGTEADPWGNDRVGLSATGALSRADYGMTFNMPLGSGGVMVADKVKLTIDVSAIKQS
jgi:polyisoprenoid-binding protein YceI